MNRRPLPTTSPTDFHLPSAQPTRRRPRALRGAVAAVGAAALLTLGACGTDAATEDAATADSDAAATPAAPAASETSEPGAQEQTAEATASLVDPEGAEVGTASFATVDAGLEIDVELTDAEPGYHGLHLHGIGECEPDSAAPDDPEDTGAFLSAGGHLGGDEAEHPEHAGDLPSILVMEDGTAALRFTTDRVTLADLTDEDGTAMILHEGFDNYANIPERYAADGADEDTLATGDAGGRAACGVIEAGS